MDESGPFTAYELDWANDELFDAPGSERALSPALRSPTRVARQRTLQQRQQAADLAFLNQGIAFTVYGRDDGTERICPYDLPPRIITSAEWAVVNAACSSSCRPSISI